MGQRLRNIAPAEARQIQAFYEADGDADVESEFKVRVREFALAQADLMFPLERSNVPRLLSEILAELADER